MRLDLIRCEASVKRLSLMSYRHILNMGEIDILRELAIAYAFYQVHHIAQKIKKDPFRPAHH